MTGRDLLKEYSHNEGQIRKLTTYLVAIAFNISPVREHSIWASRLVPLNECHLRLRLPVAGSRMSRMIAQ